jgi:ribosome-binding protein aMBF1 (putative translation factor)
MVKFSLILLMIGTASTFMYQQPACNASSPNHHKMDLTQSNRVPYLVFGTKIKNERIKQHYSIEQLANATQITQKQLENIENGSVMPVKETIYRLENILGVVFDTKQ